MKTKCPKPHEDYLQFCKDFNLVDNALKMRTLLRWNGRDLMQRENLAEHTHLAMVCAVQLLEELRGYNINLHIVSEYAMLKAVMIHDSLEILRGDILSITKDKIPGLREYVSSEEANFSARIIGRLTDDEYDIVELADLMACYKYLERELQYPNNDFCKEAYIGCKTKFDVAFNLFLKKKGLSIVEDKTPIQKRFVKGYLDDAGIDVILDRDIIFMPVSTTSFELNIQITPKEGEMALLCSRTSAASKGLVVAMCPIDPNFVGNCTAIVHNISNQIISYKKGESFCQYVMVKMIPQYGVGIKKEGTRSTSKLGGTDK